MTLRKTGVLLLAACFVGLAGCGQPGDQAADVIVIHTGRMRGNAYPASLQSISPLQHYQFLSGYLQQVREEAKKSGSRVLLVDLGDSLQGSFASYATGSRNMITLFNELGYDAVALSNLDYALDPGTLSALKAKVLNPFANAGGQPATTGTSFGTVIDKQGLPVVLMSNFYGDASSRDFPDRFPAWFGNTAQGVVPFRDYEKLAQELGKPEGSLSLLTWMKFEDPNQPPQAFLETIRGAGVHAILAHRIYGRNQRDVWSDSGLVDWNPPVSLNILRNNGGFAVSRMDLKKAGENWQVLRHEILPMTANTAPADKTILGLIEAFAQDIQKADETIGFLKAPVEDKEIFRIFQKALSKIPGTEMVLYSRESIRSDWNSGELRASHVFNSLPWTTKIVQGRLSREQVENAMEQLGLESFPATDQHPETVLVTTSEFFGRLITDKLGLSTGHFTPVSGPNEFEFFVATLKSDPGLLPAPPENTPQPSAP